MPYGVKRGFRSPGEFTSGDIMGLSLAGAAGIIAALVTDFQQKGEASALFTNNQWVIALGGVLGFTDIPLWMVVAGMTVIGAGSIFYFQPITRQGAFAQGFGLLAVMMTAVPPDLAGGIESFNDSLARSDIEFSREASLRSGVVTAAFQADEARIVQVQDSQQAAKYDLHLRINFPEGVPADLETMVRSGSIRGRLHNESTNETWNLFRTAGGTIRQEGDSLIIHAGVPARLESARLWVRIECVGHRIEEQSAMASLGEPLEWEITLEESNIPLFIQRLGKSYWF